MADDILWYIPNQTLPGHCGDGALLGASWGRPDTFTVATALATCRARRYPLRAVRRPVPARDRASET